MRRACRQVCDRRGVPREVAELIVAHAAASRLQARWRRFQRFLWAPWAVQRAAGRRLDPTHEPPSYMRPCRPDACRLLGGHAVWVRPHALFRFCDCCGVRSCWECGFGWCDLCGSDVVCSLCRRECQEASCPGFHTMQCARCDQHTCRTCLPFWS